MISVVLFDLDDTLFAHRHAVAAGVLAHRLSHGLLGDDLEELARWNELEEHHYHRYLTGELDFLEQRRERSRGFVLPHGITLTDVADNDLVVLSVEGRVAQPIVKSQDVVALAAALAVVTG